PRPGFCQERFTPAAAGGAAAPPPGHLVAAAADRAECPTPPGDSPSRLLQCTIPPASPRRLLRWRAGPRTLPLLSRESTLSHGQPQSPPPVRFARTGPAERARSRL